MSPVLRRIVVIGVGAALLLGLAAGPLSAAKPVKKTYSVTATTVPYNASSAAGLVEFTYTNTTPSGIASFNSLTLTAPNGYTIDTGVPVAVTTSSGDTGFSVANDGQTVAVTNLYPVSSGQWVRVGVWVTFGGPLPTSCDTGTPWATAAWTGSNLSGDAFQLSSPAPTTTVGTLLSAGATITVDGVTVTNLSATTCIPITITRDGNVVHIYKPTLQDVPLSVDILWDPEDAVSPLPWTQVSDVSNPDLHPIEWCSGTVSAPALPADGDVSCLVSESSQIVGPDAGGTQQVQVHDLIYLLGDWTALR